MTSNVGGPGSKRPWSQEIIQGKTTVAEDSRSFDLPPSEIEVWVDEAKKGMESAPRAKPVDIKVKHERQKAD